ncbi:serine hydrolase [Thalassomonas actiniarum]|uniref:Beta-lactamase family protein n=1 Tax=Thalassomonas actiniarum TaxID=485447 RepID=A0AAE9YPL8_9GAMM|nr:serine hydrolase domain-containing protein [Thalassomonas actiniarum]WDD97893.1 beta-lactamase family protein [Thalassomonas actiniarum]
METNKYENLALSGKYITLRHLATHTSGLPKDLAYSDDDAKKGLMIERMSNYSKDKFFNALGKPDLLSVSGEQYQYSNAGTKLVAYILEFVYDKTFESFISEAITSKSGEENTKFQRIDRGLDDVVVGTNQFGAQMPLLSPYSWAEGDEH